MCSYQAINEQLYILLKVVTQQLIGRWIYRKNRKVQRKFKRGIAIFASDRMTSTHIIITTFAVVVLSYMVYYSPMELPIERRVASVVECSVKIRYKVILCQCALVWYTVVSAIICLSSNEEHICKMGVNRKLLRNTLHAIAVLQNRTMNTTNQSDIYHHRSVE